MVKRIDLADGNRRALTLMMALAIMVCSVRLQAQNTALTGVVRNSSGQAVSGAFVKVASADSHRVFMVISREQGRYTAPGLPAGRYTVQGFGAGYQSAPGPVEVSGAQPEKMDVVLSAPQRVDPPPKAYTDAEYRAMLPEGEGKRLLLSHCVICHGPENYVLRRKDRAGWEKSLEAMRFYLQENPERRKQFTARTGIQTGPLSDPEKNVVVDYLAKHFPLDKPPLFETPTEPNRHLPKALLKGAEAKYTATELDLGNHIEVGAYVVDAQGTVWVSEKTSGTLGRLDPKTLAYTRIFTPPGSLQKDAFNTVAIDPQGRVWFTSNDGPRSQWFQYDPKDKKVVNTYDVPVAAIPGGDILFNTLVFPPNGTVWATATAKHRLVKLDPGARKVTEYPVRTGQHPFGITVGGDHMIWYAGDEDNLIVKVDPTTGRMTPYPLPTPKTRPRRITTDGDGNLWANSLLDGRLVKVDYRTGRMTEYTPPTRGAGQGIDIDRKRNLIWFSEYGAVQIGRFDPRTNSFVEFPLTNANAQPWIVQIDPTNPNRVWWNSRIGKVGYIEVID